MSSGNFVSFFLYFI